MRDPLDNGRTAEMFATVPLYTPEQLQQATHWYAVSKRDRKETQSYLTGMLDWDAKTAEAALDEIEGKSKPTAANASQDADMFPNIPDVFKGYNNWLTYKSAEEKAPIISGTSAYAKSNDPSTWVSYSTLCENIRAGRGYKGVGFIPDGERTGYLTAVDIDNCVDTLMGTTAEWAQRIVNFLHDTYTERTVSGSGLRAWVIIRRDLHTSFGLNDKAKANPELNKGAQIEVVNDKQYMTISSDVLPSSVKTVRELSAAEADAFFQLLKELQNQYSSGASVPGTAGSPNNFDDAFSAKKVYPREADGLLHQNRHKATVQELGRMHEHKEHQDYDSRLEAITEWREKRVFNPHENPNQDEILHKMVEWSLKLRPSTKVTLNQKPDPEILAREQAKQEAKQEAALDAERAKIEAAAAREALDSWLKEQEPIELTDEQMFAYAAMLTEPDYESLRSKICKKKGWKRPSVLDAERNKRRPKMAAEDNLQGAAVTITDVAPWEQPVDTTKLLDEIEHTLRRFIFFWRDDDAITTTLWIVMSWLADKLYIAPYLRVGSPEKGCGKTTLLTLVAHLTYRALVTSNASPASIFRLLEKYSPLTMVIDELDSFLRADSDHVNVLNSGYTREMGSVIRCVGEEQEPRSFKTFGAKVFGAIGIVPDTLGSRSHSVNLYPAVEEDNLEDLDFEEHPEFKDELKVLARKIARWAQDNQDAVSAIKPSMAGLANRNRDNWKPLLRIAQFAGKGWLEKARRAAGVKDMTETTSVNRQFIEDVRNIFYTRNAPFIPSDVLLSDLLAQKESGWAQYGKGRDGMTQMDLANLMKVFGVKPERGRLDGVQSRGYHLYQFADAFKRFLSKVEPEEVSLGGKSTTELEAHKAGAAGNGVAGTAATGNVSFARGEDPQPERVSRVN